MGRHFTPEEQAKWLKEQPRKPISSKVLLMDEQRRILFTKPTYKPGWGFVGGMVNKNESPLQAALREVGEEIGIALTSDRLSFLGVRYGVSKKSGDDYIHFLFSARLASSEIRTFHMQEEEVEDYKWLSFKEADQAIDIQDHTWQLAKEILHKEKAFYSDEDNIIVPFDLRK